MRQFIFSGLVMVFKKCICLIVLFALSGCATLTIASFGLSSLSYITTGKSLSDHAISAVSEQDCAMHRFIFDENVCRKNNNLIETNNRVILAKNTDQEETPQPIISINALETGPAEIVKASNNVIELTASIEKGNVSSNFGSGKQFIDKRGLYEEQWNKITRYKVIGSFNHKSNAAAFAKLYQEIGAMVIANEKTHTEKLTKAYGAKYRVVLVPYLTKTQSLEAGMIAEMKKSSHWMLSLCTKTLSQPPCPNEKVTLASTNIN